MRKAEYAIDLRERIHRIAAVTLWIVYIVVSGIKGGAVSALITASWFLLPLFCICFPNAMGAYRGIFLAHGRHINQQSHPLFVRWAGWFLHAGVPFLLWLMSLAHR